MRSSVHASYLPLREQGCAGCSEVARALPDAAALVTSPNSMLRTTGRFIARLWNDDVVGQAARMAYFFFLALFPALLFVFALTGLVGGPNAFNTVAAVLGALMPR